MARNQNTGEQKPKRPGRPQWVQNSSLNMVPPGSDQVPGSLLGTKVQDREPPSPEFPLIPTTVVVSVFILPREKNSLE